MGRVSIKNIIGKSIGKIDNQMSSGVELELGAINLLTPKISFVILLTVSQQFL